MAAVNRTQSKRFARFGDAWLSRQSRFAGEAVALAPLSDTSGEAGVLRNRVATKIPLLTVRGGGWWRQAMVGDLKTDMHGWRWQGQAVGCLDRVLRSGYSELKPETRLLNGILMARAGSGSTRPPAFAAYSA